MKRFLQTRTLAAAALMAALPLAQANIRTDASAELLFVLWDSAAHVSYTYDTGIKANDFWIYAQQDAGYSFTFTLPATDPRLIAFRAASTTITNERWAVLGVQSNASSTAAGANKLYTTMRQGPSDGSINPNWQDLTGMSAENFLGTTQRASTRWYRDLNSLAGGETSAINTHPTMGAGGSAFYGAGSPRYFANNGTIYARLNPGNEGSDYGGLYDPTNAVNQSSWFYYISNTPSSATVVTDKFDNLTYNGYWGLALTSSNTYLLSFTQAAANVPQATGATAAGTLRASTTDYAAYTGTARLIGVGDIALAGAVSAVPEPSQALLLAGGLAGLLALRRVRRVN
jgi:hypothetical protein